MACPLCGAHPNDFACEGVTDNDVLEWSDTIRELYNRLLALEEPPAKPTQESGGVCRKCGGWTTYTRQNSESGLCMKCETEKK